MLRVYESDRSAFVGISFSTHIIYNTVEHEGEFEFTGLSVIEYLRNNKNEFIARIIESQSYENIEFISNDEIIFGDFYDTKNSNMDLFINVYNVMGSNNSIDYFYIYDLSRDILIIKTKNFKEPIALNYKCDEDISRFRSILL